VFKRKIGRVEGTCTDKEEIKKLLLKGQNLSIVRFLIKNDWITLDLIAKELGLSEPMARLFLHDLESADLLEKKSDGEDSYAYRLHEPKGLNLNEILEGVSTPSTSADELREIVNFYFMLTMSIAKKLKELGGRSTYDSIVVTGTDGIEDVNQRKIVDILKEHKSPVEAADKFIQLVNSGAFKDGDFMIIRSSFKEIVRKILEANENFMGKLYGRQIVISSTKNVVLEHEDLIEKLDLLRGLPKEYFKVGGL
jgi:hypothetical protein